MVIFYLVLLITIFTSPVSAQNNTGSSYLYDGSGQRIARIEEGGEHTYYVSPTLEVTIKPDGSKTWRKSYPLSGNTSAVREGSNTNSTGTVYYGHSDHLGSTVLVTATNGTAAAKQRYFPYGTTKSESGDLHTDRKYTGQISDQDQTGLYYYNARYYDPLTAKFTQADSVNDGLNRYAYVGNNPISRIDPTGNREIDGEKFCVPGIDQNCKTLPKDPKKGTDASDSSSRESWKLFIPQKKSNDCSVAVTVMLLQYHLRSQGINIDSSKLYAYLAGEYAIPSNRLATPTSTITDTLDELGITYHDNGRPYRPVTAELMDEFLRQHGPAIILVPGSYKAGAKLNHYVVVFDVHREGNFYYAEVGDPYANKGTYSFDKTDNGNFLIPYQTLQGAYGSGFIWIDDPETVTGVRNLFSGGQNVPKVVPQ